MKNNKALEDLIKELEYSLPYKEKDLKLAFALGRLLAVEQIERMIIGMNVNGTINGVVNERQIKELVSQYKRELDEAASQSGVAKPIGLSDSW